MTSAAYNYLDRRFRPRLSAWIDCCVFPGEVTTQISDISWDGARVQCTDPAALADFPIVVEWDSGRAHDCVVVWRDNNQVGVRFIRTCMLTGPVPAPFAGARDAWMASRLK